MFFKLNRASVNVGVVIDLQDGFEQAPEEEEQQENLYDPDAAEYQYEGEEEEQDEY